MTDDQKNLKLPLSNIHQIHNFFDLKNKMSKLIAELSLSSIKIIGIIRNFSRIFRVYKWGRKYKIRS